MSTSSSADIGRIAITTAVVAVIGLLFITLFYTLAEGTRDPFGALNDVCVALGALLSGALAWVMYPLHRSKAPRQSRVALAVGLVGACLAPIGSGLVMSNLTGWFLAGLVTTFGYALIGVWLLVLSHSALQWLDFPRGLARLGIVAGWIMIIGLLAGPGIIAGTDAMESASWLAVAGLVVGGVGWNIIYTIWCIGLGRLSLSGKFRLQDSTTA